MKHLLLAGLVAMALTGCGSDKAADSKKADGAPKVSTATDTPNTATAFAPAKPWFYRNLDNYFLKNYFS